MVVQPEHHQYQVHHVLNHKMPTKNTAKSLIRSLAPQRRKFGLHPHETKVIGRCQNLTLVDIINQSPAKSDLAQRNDGARSITGDTNGVLVL